MGASQSSQKVQAKRGRSKSPRRSRSRSPRKGSKSPRRSASPKSSPKKQ